ncbi:MAG: SsrA-binding protein [Planctomycetaceae bacterium]
MTMRWLVDCDIAEYAQASIYNHARQRKRKLLLNRREIRKYVEAAESDGQTLIPLAVFFQRGLVKIRSVCAKAANCTTSDRS